ncbi:MAG: hypothetical protein P8H98_06145 [Flavobacteriales bacterium]|nr:hypothetical protein [Flavobacteriales bacterium]
MLKPFVAFICCFYIVLFCSAQTCDAPLVPIAVDWQEKQDFDEAEGKVKESLKWLCSHGMKDCTDDRESLNSYVMLWLSAHPTVKIELNTEHLSFLDSDPELLFVMIHGMALFQLLEPKEKDADLIHQAGLKAVVEVTTQTKKYAFKKELKPLRKAARKDDLVAYSKGEYKK